MRINREKFTVALLKRELTQKKFSEMTGLSRGTINGVKNGRSCSDQTGRIIAKALEMDIEELREQ